MLKAREHWLSQNDHCRSSRKLYSVDCSNLRSFALGLGMQTASPTIWTLLQNDCCVSVGGVICASSRVTGIFWINMWLNGFINGSAIPSSVLNLVLYKNQLTGSIPASLPGGLTSLNWTWINYLVVSPHFHLHYTSFH